MATSSASSTSSKQRLVRVIPRARLPGAINALDYFLDADASVEIGDVLRVPFRASSLPAIVTDFPIKPDFPEARIKSIEQPQVIARLRSVGIQTLDVLSALTHATRIQLLHALLPDPPKRAPALPSNNEQTTIRNKAKHRLVRANSVARFSEYLAFHVAHGGQTIIAVPDIVRAEELAAACVAHNLRSAVFHHKLSTGAAWRAWNALETEQADILIATKSGCLAPAARLWGIVIDNEDDGDHVQRDAFPYYDARDVYTLRAEAVGIPVLWGSETPRFSTVWQTRAAAHAPTTPANQPADVRLRPLGREPADLAAARLSHDFLEAAVASWQSGHFVLCFLNRTQHAARLVCRSCSNLVRCQRCDTAVALPDPTHAVCPVCHTNLPVPEACPTCGHTILSERGLGVEQTAAALKKMLPGIPVSVRTRATPAGTVHEPGVIIITETLWKNARPELQGLCFGAIAALDADAGLSAPNYRALERAWASLERLAGLARLHSAPLFLHTWHPDHPLFAALRNNHPASVVTPDLRERQAFHYPPFGSVVRIFAPLKDASLVEPTLERAFPGADVVPGESNDARRAVRGLQAYLTRLPQATLANRMRGFPQLPHHWIIEPDPSD